MDAFTLSLIQPQALVDLRLFLKRAAATQEGAIRVQASGQLAAVTVPVLSSQGLLDAAPTVLGMRAFELAEPARGDRIVRLSVFDDALAAAEASGSESPAVEVPQAVSSPPWAGMRPPRSAWERSGSISRLELEQVAEQGVDAVRQALPENPGQAVVDKVRGEVWSAPMGDGLCAGVAFAAVTLGFLGAEAQSFPLWRRDRWIRLALPFGQVLMWRTPSSESMIAIP